MNPTAPASLDVLDTPLGTKNFNKKEMVMANIVPKSPQSLQRASHEIQRSTVGGVSRNVEAAEAAVERIAQPRNGLFARFFPSPVDREKAAAEVRLAKTELDAIERTLIIMRESSIQTLQESVNHVLTQGKAHVRQETQVFVMHKREELIAEINGAADRMVPEIIRVYKAALTIEHPASREVQLTRADEMAYSMKDFFDKLQAEFDSILDEKIRPASAR